MANCYQAGEVFGFLRVIRAMLAMLFVTLLISNPVSAQLYSTKWIDQCHAEIPEPVPAFNCMDGHKVPKTIKNYNDGSGERKVCEHPEALYGRCVHGSRLGRLAKNNKDVDIIFSCRRDLNSNHEDVANRAKFFYDIAVIQRHRPTGKTCFYQYLGKYAEDEVVPAPMTPKGKKFWGDEKVNYCTKCHTNDPFIRTPHYWNVGTKKMVNGVEKLDQRVLPELDETTSYNVVHDHHEIFNVSRKSGNGCTACHKINAFRESASDSLKMGEINPFAAGSTNILSSARNTIPTKSRYHDFMVGRNSLVANRGTAVKELKKLENCLKMPASTDCIVVPNSSKPTYVIRSKYGCPNHKFCNAELSWDGRTGTHPRASVEFGDRVEWELVEQSTKHYVIKSKYGCPDHKFCDAELSWDGRSGTHPRASVEFNDRVEWELVKKGRSRYTIKNKYRCPNDQFCNAELSWDAVSGSHPMASVEFNDPVEWEIIQKEDAYSKDCNNSSRSYSFGRRSSLVSAPINGKITQPTQTITKIVNLESVDMVLSYFPNTTFFPNAKPIRNIVIPANKGSNKFFITPGYGRVEIERKFEFFQSRGAEIKVCFDH